MRSLPPRRLLPRPAPAVAALACLGLGACDLQSGQTGLRLGIHPKTPVDCIAVRAARPGGPAVLQSAAVPAGGGLPGAEAIKVLVAGGGPLGADEVDVRLTGHRGSCDTPPVARTAFSERFEPGKIKDLEIDLRPLRPDADGDGAVDDEDCAPSDARIFPRAAEDPQTECDGADNNCDGSVDEGCPCTAPQPCYPGGLRDPRAGVGACRLGTQACTEGRLGACDGYARPSQEQCDGQDHDCDGTAGLPDCPCEAGATRPCYVAGPASAAGKGICRPGTQTCVGGFFGACHGDVGPSRESCNGLDDDCDGVTDNPESVDTPLCENQKGLCFGARRACAPGGVAETCTEEDFQRAARANGGAWAANEDATQCDGADNDCDGFIDESCSCARGAVEACHPLGAANPRAAAGQCRRGERRCGADERWGDCAGAVAPEPERCDDVDNDCDGSVDDDVPGAGYACEAGRTGVCLRGQRRCAGGVVACVSVQPAGQEVCDGLDNDCDGTVDEGFDKRHDPASCGGPADCRACPAGASCCDGRCSDPANDPRNCGGCGQACPAGKACCGASCLDASTDLAHCGTCGNACAADRVCRGGECVLPAEASCANGADDDRDGPADCADPDCAEGAACAADGSRACRAGRCLPRHETACDDRADDDADGLTDCADALDCPAETACGAEGGAARACRRGRCVPAAEGDCADAGDEDLDGFTDCQDSEDCPAASSCDARGGVCRNGACAHESSCSNRLDDDGDGFSDCADVRDCPPATACDATGGTCGAGRCRHEDSCSDRADDDGDRLVDCADPDCGIGAACGGGGTCCDRTGARVCAVERACTDGVDNDCDRLVDCHDPDCGCPSGKECCNAVCTSTATDPANCGTCGRACEDGLPCTTNACQNGQCATTPAPARRQVPGCDGAQLCCNGGCASAAETLCADGTDDDCDGRTDCQDPDCGCAGGAVCCGAACASLGTDPDNCGACGNRCPDPGPCVERRCVQGSCAPRPAADRSVCGATDSGNVCCAGSCRSGNESTYAQGCGNGLDDDCDGLLDCQDPNCFPTTAGQVFCPQDRRCHNLKADNAACGQCGRACAPGENCVTELLGGRLATRCKRETTGATMSDPALCADGVDGDSDGLADCADPDCPDTVGCGGRNRCCGGRCVLEDCANRIDDDCNGLVDCLDLSGCQNRGCGVPTLGTATCKSDGVCHEGNCQDGLDNDRDGLTECADTADCPTGVLCAGGYGSCQGGQCAREAIGRCGDGTDNDLDGRTDCADTVDCPDRTGCDFDAAGTQTGACRAGACVHETGSQCQDGTDNDDDGFTDCADRVDCPAGTPCAAGWGRCVANGTCRRETGAECGDGIDNDGDGRTDCADAGDCPAGTWCDHVGGNRTGACTAAGACGHESVCGNGVDDDGDNLLDCQDVVDCPSGTLCAGGFGRCIDGGSCRREVGAECGNGLDDDGDGKTDCADTADCPAGTWCDYVEGQRTGACTAGGACGHETVCNNAADDDGDGLPDCQDRDCNNANCADGKQCVGGSCVCNATFCADGCCNASGGCVHYGGQSSSVCGSGAAACFSCANPAGASCTSGVCHETNCANLVDDDGQGGADCADTGDCTAGAVCADDGNDCRWDRCDGSGSCTHPKKADGTACGTDNKACTTDVCDDGTCEHNDNCDTGCECRDDPPRCRYWFFGWNDCSCSGDCD